MEWIEEILNWPASWSALHGIAQVKTPVLKVSTRTDATAHEFVVRRPGRRMPDEAAAGLVFPFRTPERPGVTHSMAFRARARGPDCALHRAPELVCVGQRLQFGDGDGRSAPADRGARPHVDWRHRAPCSTSGAETARCSRRSASRGRISSRSAWTSTRRSWSTRGSSSRRLRRTSSPAACSTAFRSTAIRSTAWSC